MRILYIIPTFQHPKVRGSDRHYHFVRELSQRHSITLLTPVQTDIAPEALQEMTSYTERILLFRTKGTSPFRNLLKRVPAVGNRLADSLEFSASVKEMKQAFRRIVKQEQFDLVLFHGKSVFSVIEGWQGLPLVVDFCDATSMRIRNQISYAGKAKAPLLALRYLQVRQIEKKLVSRTPFISFISCRDRAAILGPNDRSHVIPNGIDLQYWQRKSNNRRSNSLIFTGVMNYAPNEDAALYLIDSILPLLRQRIPDLETLIVGRDPTLGLLERAKQHQNVTVTGFVEDIRPYLEQATLFVAPLRYASGMQNKIQEALAMEVPVVTTSIVADGLQTGEDKAAPLCIADDPAAFADQIVFLLGQEAERTRLAAEGRRFAEKHFVWAESARQLEQICCQATGVELRLSTATEIGLA